MAHYYDVTRTKGLVVVDFAAGWCGPCRMIGPHVDSLAAQYQSATFAKVTRGVLALCATTWRVLGPILIYEVRSESLFLLFSSTFSLLLLTRNSQVQEDDGMEGKAIVAEAGIRAFPTFFFFIDGTKR